MIKTIIAIIVFLLVITFETSFISSLPIPFSFFPLVLLLSVYLMQYRSSQIGIWWLAGYGLYLDYMHIGSVFGESLIWLITAILTYLVAKRLFTHRSLYGILGCGLVAWLTTSLLHLIFTFGRTFNVYLIWQLVFLFLGLIILFNFSKYFKRFLS